MLTQLRAFSYHAGAIQDPRRVTITTPDQLTSAVRQLQEAPVRADDTETSGLRWDLHARACGASWAVCHPDGSTQSWYLPWRHQTGEAQIPEDVALRALRDLYAGARPDQVRWWWNKKFDQHILRHEGITLTEDRDLDASIAARFFDENTSARLKVRALVDLGDLEASVYEAMLDRETARLAALNGLSKEAYKDRYGFSQIPIHMAGQYAVRDGEYTLRLARFYQEKGVLDWYSRPVRGPNQLSVWHTEQLLTSALVDIEEWGLQLDTQYLHWLREETYRAIDRLESQIWQQLGHHRRFNLDSDDELRHFLVNVCGLQLYKTTRGGEFAVDREVLDEFAEEAPWLAWIRDRREAKKIASTYTDSLIDRCDVRSILHGDYQAMNTDTGRASCRKPNLQNISSDSDARALAATGKKLEEGGRDPWSIRRAFPVRQGPGRWVRLFCDWSQIELRVLADETQDPQLLEAYRTGEDLHDKTTRLIFGSVEKSKRKVAKMANFGTAFGLTPMGLSRRAKIPLEEAEAFMAQFDQAYRGLPAFRQRLWGEMRANKGWTQNKFGRTRRIPQICSPDPREQARAERQAVASRIQGTAADMSKNAAVRLHQWLRAERLESRFCGWVHDEFQIDVPVHELAYVAPRAKAIMEDFPGYSIPIVADVEYTATNWSEKHDLEGL